ncbi:hypothetical protein J437_LFUL003786 [Ladona fulva]|uniref:Uncharacterized protein n=1 Tax=Ladona fulva TaxID=123851 RepID=A0A8K0NWT8_LADFU|nr:hypothetical protein J437_LFUL003786 [Ladona fulva]
MIPFQKYFCKGRTSSRKSNGKHISSHNFTFLYKYSKLAKLFNGSIPIVLDSLKQHYFIDRDGRMFRHILNFMRNARLLVPENFADLDLLLEEAKYFEIAPTSGPVSPMIRQLEQLKKERMKAACKATVAVAANAGSGALMGRGPRGIRRLGGLPYKNHHHRGPTSFVHRQRRRRPLEGDAADEEDEDDEEEGGRGHARGGAMMLGPPEDADEEEEDGIGRRRAVRVAGGRGDGGGEGGGGGVAGGECGDVEEDEAPEVTFECVALHVSPDLGERVMLSGDRALIDEAFPETSQALMDVRSGVAWNAAAGGDPRHVIRFPLNGYCKLNSVQAVTRLLNAGFRVAASNGGGVEGQQFSEYLFVRRVYNS